MSNRRSANVGPSKGMTAQEHSIRLSEHIKNMDANPRSERTALGLWQTGKGGTATTTYDSPPVVIQSKRKYRG